MQDGINFVQDSLVVGRSMTNSQGTGNPHGIIAPRSDKWTIKNIRFHNFDFGNAAAIGTCSHCYFDPSTDSDGRTVRTQELSFTNVDMRVRYQFPHKGILYDADGTLTGGNPGSWATSMWQHNVPAGDTQCSVDMAMYDGIVCDETVQVRRVLMYGANPGSLNGKDLWILPYDESIVGAMNADELIAYEADSANYGIVPWRNKKNPDKHWAVPFVTGRKYLVRWAFGLDFVNMNFEIIPWLWDSTDGNIHFVMPHYDVREAVYVDDNLGTRYDNNTLVFVNNKTLAETPKTDAELVFGDNLVRNDTETRRIDLIINGDNEDINKLKLTGVRCVSNCVAPIPEDEPLEDRIRYWSILADWEKGRAELPKDGDDVVIPSSWRMMYDIAEEAAPKLNSLEVNGVLQFHPGADRLLKVYNLWVRAGTLNIG